MWKSKRLNNGVAGYTPNTEQTDDARLVLRILYALVPSVCNLLGVGIALAYPISDSIHREIRQAITRWKQVETVYDPLHPDEKPRRFVAE